MSILARIALGFFSVVWIAACGGLIAMAWTPDRKLDIELADFELEAFIIAGDAEKWLFTAIVALAALLGVLAFLLAVRRRDDRGPKGTLRLKQADGGTVEVTAEALEHLVAAEMRELPDVHDATAHVRLKGNSVATDLLLKIGGSVSIANVTANAGTKLNEVFRDQVGVVDVRRPLVRIDYDGTRLPVQHSAAGLPPPPPNAAPQLPPQDYDEPPPDWDNGGDMDDERRWSVNDEPGLESPEHPRQARDDE